MFDGQFAPYQPMQFEAWHPPGYSAGITFVGAIAGGAADGGSVTLDLSALGLQQNDIVCVFGGHGRNANAGVSTAGYTEEATLSGTDQELSFSRKFMSSSPDTSVVCLGSANVLDAAAYVAMAFRGVNTTTPMDATPATLDGSLGDNPNPPSITTVTAGAMVLACGGTRSQDTAITTPSGYSAVTNNVHYGSATDGRPQTSAIAYLLKAAAGAENPGAYSNWTGDAAREWGSMTIALRPA